MDIRLLLPGYSSDNPGFWLGGVGGDLPHR